MSEFELQMHIAAHQRKARLLRQTACLAVIVAACTAYALVRPAITRELLCTIPEHSHTDACYEEISGAGEQSALTCTDTDASHTHGPRCYGTWVLTCGTEEHVHTEFCYSDMEDLLPDASSAADESETGESDAPEENTAPAADGALCISLLYGDGQPQEAHPDGVSYYTRSTMSGYIRLEPRDLDNDLQDVTVTLSFPAQYVEKNSILIPSFSTNSEITQYEILPVEEDGENYRTGIHFTVYDKTQTLILPFMLSFLDDVVPDNYQLPVIASVSGGETSAPSIYRPQYRDWAITKYVNSNRVDAFQRDGAEVVVTPLEDGGNPYLDDLTYVDFAFIVNSYTNVNCYLGDLRDASEVTLTDILPGYTDRDGQSCIAAFDAEQNPGWTLSDDGRSVSKIYSGTGSSDVLLQIYSDALHLRFPGLPFETAADGSLIAQLSNTVQLSAVPSGAAPGETHPSAEDPLLFCLTNDTDTQGTFTKGAKKGDIYDVDIYKTNPYPWGLSLSNSHMQPLRHIVIQDRRITGSGETALAGLDEALKFVRLESDSAYSALPEGTSFTDIIEKVVACYTDGTTQDIFVTQADRYGNFSVAFDESRICDGFEIVFRNDYELRYGERVNFTAYTVYRDPEGSHVPAGAEKVNYRNEARAVNAYFSGGQTVYSYSLASDSYNMLPSTENLTIEKLTLCNDGTTTLVGRGGNHVGDYYLYALTLRGSLLEPDVKKYEDLRIVDLLPDGVTYDSIYLLQCNSGYPFLDGGIKYQPETAENYHNSGRTAIIFHLNAENLKQNLATSKFVTLYFWVQINETARTGIVRNEAYVVGNNLDEYQGSSGGTADSFDLNNNGRTDDSIAWSFSDATIIAAQSIYAEKFIAPAGSDSWSKQGLSLKAGSEFDYLLKVTNETSAEYTGLTVYDALPQPGDRGVFGTMSRNSEFRVRLRGAITPPAGYTVFYTTSPNVSEQSMHEMVSADIWTDSVSDYSAVTAFKLVANEGVVLSGQSVFQVRIPAEIPAASVDDAKALLSGKTDLDQSSGTITCLQAKNSFGFRTAQSASEKESNTVWVRIPFAGFCIQKIDGVSGEGLPGAEFTLTDAAGGIAGTAVSDAQGLLRFRNLTEGVYTLVETKTPDGYIDEHISVSVTISQNPVTMEYSVSFGEYPGAGSAADPLRIENYGTYRLPETGGKGVLRVQAAGTALLLAPAVLLPAFRRKRARKRL